MNRPCGNQVPPPIMLHSPHDNKVVIDPPDRSEARSRSPDRYEIRFPSSKKCTQQKSSRGKIRRACVPSDDMIQVSSPGFDVLLPKFAPNAIIEPSGEMLHT